MATLPRSSKLGLGASFQRTHSEFDAGLNSSAAWTEHLESASACGSLSDEEPDAGDNDEPLRLARALYDFEGKAEFRELTVKAGDEIDVVKETLADGWSLVKDSTTGEVGLLPRAYYTFTNDFTPAPNLEAALPNTIPYHAKKEVSSDSITPRGSLNMNQTSRFLIPQNTGEWHRMFPSFRKSLLGGKTLNRFSSFVTSGAEDFLLKGTPAESIVPTPRAHDRNASEATINEEEQTRLNRLGLGEADRHFVEAGPVWKEKLPPFRVLVHSPSKRTSTFSGAYTIYSVTSLFHPLADTKSPGDTGATRQSETRNLEPVQAPSRVTVFRRFSHFVILHAALSRRLPGVALPPLPEKQYAGRFSEDFVEARRGDLERYIGRVVRHPVARYAEVLMFFLSCESEAEWDRSVPQHLSMPPAGSGFYARVYHPAFNVDGEEAEEAVQRFDQHTKAVGKGVQGLRNTFGRIREARIEMSKAERLLSYSLLSLITSKPLASARLNVLDEDENDYDAKSKGLLNEDGAWCWRENCQECLKLTKAIQKTSETLQHVADLYDDHARRTQLATHESLKGMAHPASLYEGVVTTQRATLSRYKEAIADDIHDEEVAARCETVLNTTMAEMEIYHTQKEEDFQALMKEHLDGEIGFYKQILHRLESSRAAFDPPQFDEFAGSPRQPSIYEREFENPRFMAKPLSQPCPHVFDSAPMRPVSVAIQEGVSLFLNSSARGSMFGKFW